MDWSSVTFSITGFLFLRALQSAHFIDIIPIARDRLLSSLSDGMIVVDIKNRIIDINPAAASILEMRPPSVIGKSLRETIPIIDSRLNESPMQEFRTEFKTGSDPQRNFDVLISPLYERDLG